jgi:hypothetical protein
VTCHDLMIVTVDDRHRLMIATAGDRHRPGDRNRRETRHDLMIATPR